MAQKTTRKQISVSLTESEHKRFTDLMFDLRQRRDSDGLRLAIAALGDAHGVQVLDIDGDDEIVDETPAE